MRLKNQYLSLLILSTVFYAGCSAVNIWMAMLLGDIFDTANAGNQAGLIQCLVTCVAASITGLALAKAGIYFRMLYVRHKMVDLKDHLMENIFSMPMRDFLRNDQGYYLNLLTSDSERIEEDYYRSVPLIIYYCCQFVFSIIVMIFVSPLLLIIFSAAIVLMAVVPQIFSGILARRQKECSDISEKYLSALKDIVAGIETIKLANGKTAFLHQFHDVSYRQQESIRKMRDMRSFTVDVSDTCQTFAQIIGNGAGGILVILGKVTIGDLIISLQLSSFAFQAVGVATEKVVGLRAVRQLLDKVKSLLLKQNTSSEVSTAESGNDICYKNVSFSFDGHPILQGLNQTFADGKCYAIIGPSGSGKSTLVKLLMQYYGNYSGEILLGNQEISALSESEIYHRIQYVSQTPYLFNTSLMNNITLFKTYPQEKIQEVIRKTNLEGLLQRYQDEPVGDSGQRISGGERQRISLARALLIQPQIIVFDEPTSALDPQNARLIMEMIFSMEGTTRIVITHNHDANNLERFTQVLRFPVV